MNKYLYIVLIFFVQNVYSQEFVQFFYSDSTVSSEGFMVDNKPDGYWKTYYPNGTIKSIGKRTNFELDSIWNFYTEDGILHKQISYFEGLRNGYTYTYYTRRDTFFIKSKELYVQNKKETVAYYFSEYGYLEKQIPYVHNKKEGRGYELNSDSVIIAILQFSNNQLVHRQTINRFDSEGKKVGTWIEFHPNGVIKTESNYVSGTLQGLYKMFDTQERLLRVGTYNQDTLLYSSQLLEDFEEPFEIITFHSDSVIKSRGQFKNAIPIGIHRFYTITGVLDSCVLYDMYGTLLAVGIMQEDGTKTGNWKYFYPNQQIQSQGNYVNNLKSGEWIFYYETGDVKQKGNYFQGLESGVWQWYLKTGELKKREEYAGGKRNGLSEQFDNQGNKIIYGSYIDNQRHGNWYTNTGDLVQNGTYVYGSKDGVWNHYYVQNGRKRFEGQYFNTQAHGRHRYFYENGALEREEIYRNGVPVRRWSYYDSSTRLLYTVYYRNGKEFKTIVGERRRR